MKRLASCALSPCSQLQAKKQSGIGGAERRCGGQPLAGWLGWFGAAAALAGAAAWPGASAAQAALAEPEEILVTARRREEALIDIPIAITALDEFGIRQRGVTELNQVEKFAPNLVQTNFGQGNTGHAAAFMRGIGLQDHIITTDPAVGIYLDGVYLGRNMGANMDLMNIERVEVARGPQGSLSGRNTLGGALNIHTRKPSGDGLVRFDLKAGSRGRLNGNAFADWALADGLFLSASGGFKSRNGLGEALGIPHPEAAIGEIRQGFGRAALLWQAADGLSLLATADLARSDQGVTPHAVEVFNRNNGFGLLPEDQPANPDDTHSLNNELMSTEDRTRGVSLTLDWDIAGRLDLQTILAYRDMWFEGGLDNEKVAATLIEFPERGEAEQWTLEIQLSGVADWGDWVTGLYWFSEEGFNDSPFVFRSEGLSDGRPEVIPASDFDGRLYIEQQTDSRAAFAHANVDLSERWTLGLGGRYTRDEKDALGALHYFPAPARRRDGWGEVTGDLSLTWRLNSDLNAFLSYARGYQAGGYPPRPFGGPETFVAFDPSFADSFELGLKGAFGPNLTLNAALFRVAYRDLAVQQNELIGEGFLTLTQNAAESQALGAELEGRWEAAPGFSVQFAFGYIDIGISRVDDRVQGIEKGDSPALTPRFTASLSPQCVWNLGSGSLEARLDYYHRSAMFGQPSNSPLNRMAPVDLLSASLGYESLDGAWRLSIYGHNLSNAIYPLAKLDLDPTVLIINSNDRREYGVRIGWKFGGA